MYSHGDAMSHGVTSTSAAMCQQHLDHNGAAMESHGVTNTSDAMCQQHLSIDNGANKLPITHILGMLGG